MASKDLSARTPDAPDTGTAHSTWHTVREGTWWRYEGDAPMTTETDDILAEPGEVLLLTEVLVHEHEVHTVEMKLHPKRLSRGHDATFALRAHELAHEWREVDGKAERARDIDALERRIADTELEVERLARTERREALAWTPDVSGDQTLAHVASERAELTERKVALERAAARIGEATKALIPYHEEQLTALRAGQAQAVEAAKRAGAALDILALYAGDGVTVRRWNEDAAPAPADAPLRAYQRTRYVDEESLWHVLDGAGGADVRDVATYVGALASSPSARTRVVPTPRCVVAVQARRRRKDYADLLSALQYAPGDAETFLLIRNGERFTTVHWEMGTWPRLIPKRTTWKSLFRERARWEAPADEGWVGVDDVRFVKVLERAQATMRRYLTAWVVLAGLHLREQVFAPIAAEERLGRPLNLMVPRDHDALVEVVRDEEDALGRTLAPWHEFRSAQNALARAGGRVVIVARAAYRDAPAWYTQRAWSERWRDSPAPPADRPASRTPEVAEVEQRDGDLQVRIRGRRGAKRAIVLHAPSNAWLWIEDTDTETLRAYITHAREDYLAVMPLAVPALRALEADARSDAQENASRQARAIARRLRAGRTPAKQLVARIDRALTAVRDHTSAIRALASAGQAVLETAVARDGRLVVHTPWPGDDGRAGGLRWTRRTHIALDRSARPVNATPEDTPATLGGEHKLGGAGDSAPFDGRRRRIDANTAAALHRAVACARPGVEAWAERLRTDARLRVRLGEWAVAGYAADGKYVVGTGCIAWPVAVVTLATTRDDFPEARRRESAVLAVQCTALRALAASGAADAQERIATALSQIYARPEQHIDDYARRPTHWATVGDWVLCEDPDIFLSHGDAWTPAPLSAKDTGRNRRLARREALAVDAHGRLRTVESQGAGFARGDDDGKLQWRATDWRLVDHPGGDRPTPWTTIADVPKDVKRIG